jgi:hypothetical protein
METFLILIGIAACTVLIMLAAVKTIEAIWFFQRFRDDTAKKLDRIQEALNSRKP